MIGEQSGGAIGQSSSVSCGAACGEMLTDIPEADLIRAVGAPTDPSALARGLGGDWRGGYVGPDQLDALTELGRPWAAELYEGGKLGHMVVVDGAESGNFLIRDPWAGGSTYQMTTDEFMRVWTGRAVFR